MTVSRGCYDKYHRCPGWAGGGWRFPKESICASGGMYQSGYNYGPRVDWLGWRCSTCGTRVLPRKFRFVDPRYYIGIWPSRWANDVRPWHRRWWR